MIFQIDGESEAEFLEWARSARNEDWRRLLSFGIERGEVEPEAFAHLEKENRDLLLRVSHVVRAVVLAPSHL